MEIYNHRFKSGKDSSLGVLNFEKEPPFCFIPEDEARVVKKMGETRIRAGRYRLSILKVDTPLTLRHRKSRNYQPWFKYHIVLENVPNFTGVYFHIGNDEGDTDACQLPNYTGLISKTEFSGLKSSPATRDFYARVYPLLERGVDVFYNVIDL